MLRSLDQHRRFLLVLNSLRQRRQPHIDLQSLSAGELPKFQQRFCSRKFTQNQFYRIRVPLITGFPNIMSGLRSILGCNMVHTSLIYCTIVKNISHNTDRSNRMYSSLGQIVSDVRRSLSATSLPRRITKRLSAWNCNAVCQSGASSTRMLASAPTCRP